MLDANAMADEDDLPPGLDSGLDRVRQLAAAKAAGSVKLNDTQYAMETLSVAKNLRATYGTGYRDYIDSEVSKASGLPVANSYYQNLMLDINRQMTQMGKTKDDISALAMKNLDVPGIGDDINKRRAGDPTAPSDADMITKITKWQNLQTQYKLDGLQRAASDASKADKIEDTAAKATANFSTEVNLGLKNITSQAGVPSAGALQQYLTDVALGKHPEASQDEINQRIMQLDGITQAQRQSLWSKGHEMGPDGSSIASTLGEERFKKTVDDAMYPLDTFSRMAKDKDSGPAFMVAHQNAAIKDQDVNSILIHKDTGPAARQYEAVRSILGDGAFPDYMKSIAQNGLPDPLSTLYTQEALSSIKPITDIQGKPLEEPRTLNDAIKHGKDIAKIPGAPDPEPAGYFGKLVGHVANIADPKMPLAAKDALVKWAFGPKNVNNLDELNMDYKDPKTGETVPGKYAAYNIMSAPKITQGVKETAKVHPENYTQYQDTLEQQFAKLYRADLQTLMLTHQKMISSIPVGPDGQPIRGPVGTDTPVTNKPTSGLNFSYDSEHSRIGLVDGNNRPITRATLSIRDPNYSGLSGSLDTLDRINSGVKNLAYVYKENPSDHGDVDEHLLRTLQTSVHGRFGYDDQNPLQGVTPGMMKAIIKANAPEMTPQDLANKVLRYTDDKKQGPSVQQFVSNPTGEPLPKRVSGNVVGPNESIIGTKSDEIPAGMTVQQFIQELKRTGRY